MEVRFKGGRIDFMEGFLMVVHMKDNTVKVKGRGTGQQYLGDKVCRILLGDRVWEKKEGAMTSRFLATSTFLSAYQYINFLSK